MYLRGILEMGLVSNGLGCQQSRAEQGCWTGSPDKFSNPRKSLYSIELIGDRRQDAAVFHQLFAQLARSARQRHAPALPRVAVAKGRSVPNGVVPTHFRA